MATERLELYDSARDILVAVDLSVEDAARVKTDSSFAQKVLEDLLMKEPPVETSNSDNMEHQYQYWTSIGEEMSGEPEVTEGTNIEPLENEVSLYRWSPSCVKLLLEVYKKKEEVLHSGRMPQKKVFEEIAQELKKHGYATTGPQCSSKLRSLKKTFKSIKDHNNKSGNDRRNWAFLQIMEDIFGKKAWCEPVAVASSSGMSIKNTPEKPQEETTGESDSGCSSKSKVSIQTLLLRRLKQREEHEKKKEARHKEKMEMDKKFLNILEQLANK